MRLGELEHLAALGGICGARYVPPLGGRLCCLPPGHAPPCSADFPRRRLTPYEKRTRQLARARAERDRRTRQREHLREQIRARDAKIARMEAFRLYRLEYRLRGALYRLRRWRRQLRRAVRDRSLRRWRW